MYDVRQIFEFSLAVPDGGPPEYANKYKIKKYVMVMKILYE